METTFQKTVFSWEKAIFFLVTRIAISFGFLLFLFKSSKLIQPENPFLFPFAEESNIVLALNSDLFWICSFFSGRVNYFLYSLCLCIGFFTYNFICVFVLGVRAFRRRCSPVQNVFLRVKNYTLKI